MRKLHGIYVLLGLGLLLLLCTLPTDPIQNYNNVRVDIVPFEGNDTTFAVNESLYVALELDLPHLINYVSVSVNSGTPSITPCTFEQKIIDTLSLPFVFQTPGIMHIKLQIVLKNGAILTDSLNVTILGTAPVITRNLPPFKYVDEGKACTLSVEATSPAAMTYSWYKVGDTTVLGTTNPFITAPVTQADSGLYYCVIESAWNKTTSSQMVLIVHQIQGKELFWVSSSIVDSVYEGDTLFKNVRNLYTKPEGAAVVLTTTEKSSQYAFVADSVFVFEAGKRDSGDYAIQVKISSGANIDSAVFHIKVLPRYCTLTITADSGTVSVVPSLASYRFGDSVTLQPAAKTGYQFYGWVGDFTSAEDTIKIEITKNLTLKAQFILDGSGCNPLEAGTSLNSAVKAASVSTARPKLLCPAPGLYENRTVKINGKIRISIQ